jgi:hypothetical protein
LRARDGSYSPILFNLGPARLGTLIESIAVPELREQAVDLAAHLASQLSRSSEEEVLEFTADDARGAFASATVEDMRGAA